MFFFSRLFYGLSDGPRFRLRQITVFTHFDIGQDV